MKLKQLIKEYNLELSENDIYECQEFFGTNVDENNKKKLINDILNYMKNNTKYSKEVSIMSKEIKNMFPALSAVLKANKISLEKDEFKTVLDHINGKAEVKIKISPIAEKVIEVFEMNDLEENQFYLVEQRSDYFTEIGDYQAVAKTRTQLLAVLLTPEIIFPDIHIMSFGKPFSL